uniref:Tetraspanin n=1 Tax=Anoplophora glabripennis TaxID=217634 RepID=V5G3W6_ANOGL
MGCAEGLVKLIVFAVNLVFALAGLALIIIGVIYKLNLNDFTSAIPEEYHNIGLASIFTIAIGSVIFIIAFFGCCGAIRESPCLLLTYSVILLIIFLAQIAIGVFAFLQINDKGDFEDEIRRTLTTIFNNYDSDKTNASRTTVDFMQHELECCGLDGPAYWLLNRPLSCYDASSNKVFEDGCIKQFFNFLNRSIRVIGITVLTLSTIEVVGAIFSLCLANSIKNRERRFRY